MKSLVAYAEVNGYRFGTTIEELRSSDIYVIDPNGIEYLKQHCGDGFKFIEILFLPHLIYVKADILKEAEAKKNFTHDIIAMMNSIQNTKKQKNMIIYL